MDLSKSGGPAFPSFIDWGPEDRMGFEGEPAGEEGERTYYSGLSTRDWLAATIPLGVSINEEHIAVQIVGRDLPTDPVEAISFAFEMEARLRYMKADAMLKVREM